MRIVVVSEVRFSSQNLHIMYLTGSMRKVKSLLAFCDASPAPRRLRHRCHRATNDIVRVRCCCRSFYLLIVHSEASRLLIARSDKCTRVQQRTHVCCAPHTHSPPARKGDRLKHAGGRQRAHPRCPPFCHMLARAVRVVRCVKMNRPASLFGALTTWQTTPTVGNYTIFGLTY